MRLLAELADVEEGAGELAAKFPQEAGHFRPAVAQVLVVGVDGDDGVDVGLLAGNRFEAEHVGLADFDAPGVGRRRENLPRVLDRRAVQVDADRPDLGHRLAEEKEERQVAAAQVQHAAGPVPAEHIGEDGVGEGPAELSAPAPHVLAETLHVGRILGLAAQHRRQVRENLLIGIRQLEESARFGHEGLEFRHGAGAPLFDAHEAEAVQVLQNALEDVRFEAPLADEVLDADRFGGQQAVQDARLQERPEARAGRVAADVGQGLVEPALDPQRAAEAQQADDFERLDHRQASRHSAFGEASPGSASRIVSS